MKTRLIILGIAASIGLMSFTNPSSKKEETYKVDVNKSTLAWNAKKVTGQHNGAVKITSGTLTSKGSDLTGGKFVIDMTSITCNDLQGEWNGKLVGHLKSDDFFSVEKNPTSTLEITKITPSGDRVNVDGNLTIKGITKPISFPASISQKESVLVAVATIKVDRTKYDIRYGSKSFFEGIGDKAIDDEFEIQVNLVATK